MTLILYTLLIICVILLFLKFKRRFELGNKIPGPIFIPLIGNFQFARLKPEGVFLLVNELRKKYNNCFRLWLGPNLWIFLHTPEQTKEALNNPYLKRAENFQLLKPLIGDGLLISEGRKWSLRRKALNPAFSTIIIENFLESFSYHADILVQQLKIYEKIEITDRLFPCILDIICETSMGTKINSQTDNLGIYTKAFHDASHLLFKRMTNPLYGFDFIYKQTKGYKDLISAIKVIHDLTDKLIKQRYEKILEEKQNNDDKKIREKSPLLDTLFQITIDGKLLKDDEIKEEVNTFLFAGVDTTKSAMSFIFYNLAKYKNIQDKLYNEIKLQLNNDNNKDYNLKQKTITITHINHMNYLDLVIKESLRLHTTVPLTGRQTIKEIQICNIQIPENSTIWINMYGLAHDENLFPKPYEFHPERFNRKNINDEDDKDNKNDNINQIIQLYSYLPFSGGLHTCIGKKYSILMMKIIIIKILINYEISLVNPNEELDLIAEMVLKSKNGINLILKER